MKSYVRSNNGIQAYNVSDTVNSLAIAANTHEESVVPALAGIVLVKSTAPDLYVKVNGTATIPTDITNGTASALNVNGHVFGVTPGDSISVITATATAVVTFEYFSGN